MAFDRLATTLALRQKKSSAVQQKKTFNPVILLLQ